MMSAQEMKSALWTWIREKNKVCGMNRDNLFDNYLMKNAARVVDASSAG